MFKYLYTARFADGSFVDQPEGEDVSKTDPKRNTFFDIMERTKSGKPEDQLVSFHLQDQETKNEWAVNLVNGLFYMNGNPFCIHDEYDDFDQGQIKDFQLIWFHKVTQTISDEGSGEIRFYRIGWQSNHPKTGRKVQRVIMVG